MFRRVIIALAAVIAATLLGAGPALAQALIEESTFLTVQINGRPVRLEALIVKPAGVSGRLPIALITHGKNFSAEENAAKRARDQLPQARDLAHRGWLVVSVVRRGFGLSTGPQAPDVDCAHYAFQPNFERNADDLAAALAVVARRPDADPRRVIAVGVSAGGATAMALGARRIPGLVGIVNVSGGLRLSRNGVPCQFEPALIATFANFGARTRVPTLWLYAENDSLFGPKLVRAMHAAYRRAGGQAELTQLPPLAETDGHQLWSNFNGRKLWLPLLDRFLAAHALPTWDRGKVETRIAALPIGQASRPVIETYLAAPTEKVLAISQSSRRVFWWAGGDLVAMRQKSLESCQKQTGERCSVVMENFGLPGADVQVSTTRLPGSS